MSFEQLGLSAEILRAVSETGYTQPTAIQSAAIPYVLSGRDLMAAAQTGTGKTAGFTLPVLQHLTKNPLGKGFRPVRALVLTPTRELAAQVAENVAEYGKYTGLRSAVIFGGVNINPQFEKLRRGADIVIATPGRLLDHVSQKSIDLSKVEILVLDEADRMLDMGFIHDVRKLINLLPSKRQNLLFSATFSEDIRRLSREFLDRPEVVEVAARNKPADRIEQVVHPVDQRRKRELLSWLIGSGNWQQVLIFTRTKHGANRLSQQLERDGINSSAIHGNKSQGARTRALEDFRSGKVRALVATDIAARGLDIDQLPHVVNFELPNVPEDYVHRIGRTGRAGCEGQAVSLVCAEEAAQLRDIQTVLQAELPRVVVEGYEPDREVNPGSPKHKLSSGRGKLGSRAKQANQGRTGRRPERQPRSNRDDQSANSGNGSKSAGNGGGSGNNRHDNRPAKPAREANGNVRGDANGNVRSDSGSNRPNRTGSGNPRQGQNNRPSRNGGGYRGTGR